QRGAFGSGEKHSAIPDCQAVGARNGHPPALHMQLVAIGYCDAALVNPHFGGEDLVGPALGNVYLVGADDISPAAFRIDRVRAYVRHVNWVGCAVGFFHMRFSAKKGLPAGKPQDIRSRTKSYLISRSPSTRFRVFRIGSRPPAARMYGASRSP